MSLSGALSVALSGLQVSTTAVQVISGNVSNADTVGYTEKTLNLTPVVSGSTLGGVQIASYSRASDSVLSATLNSSTSSASYLSTQNGYMENVQSILDSTSTPPALSSALSNFQAAWTQYSASPSDPTLKASVVSTGQALANTINSIASQTATLQTNVQDDLSTNVASLNSDLSQVQALNVQITAAQANGQPIVNLQDSRDDLVGKIAQFTNVTEIQRNNGQIALYTSSGTPLVDGQAQVFSVGSDQDSVVNSVGANVSSALSGGSLQAQTDFLSPTSSNANGVGVITNMQSQLQNFANMFISTASGSFADQYNSATTATGDQASSFFTAGTASNGLPDLASFAVNASLVSGATSVKAGAATAITNAFNATNLSINSTTNATSSTFSAGGLTAQNQTYSGVATAILSGFQQAANTIQSQSATATTQQTYYQNALSSETGVNTDTELVNLTSWENSYAASAHVISIIQQMMQTLTTMVT